MLEGLGAGKGGHAGLPGVAPPFLNVVRVPSILVMFMLPSEIHAGARRLAICFSVSVSPKHFSLLTRMTSHARMKILPTLASFPPALGLWLFVCSFPTRMLEFSFFVFFSDACHCFVPGTRGCA